MKIGGLHRFSLIDFPKKISALVFTQGCNFRCPFCHNPELVLPRRFQLPIPPEEVYGFLLKRIGKLDGVVITGGEPLIQAGLEEFIVKIRYLGYAVKLDTNGCYPSKLDKFIKLGLLDYIAMDIKAAPANYPAVCGVPVNLDKISKSINLIRESGLPYEFRTTIVKNLHTPEEFHKIVQLLRPHDNYVIQNYRPAKRVGHRDLPLQPFEDADLQSIFQILSENNLNYTVR